MKSIDKDELERNLFRFKTKYRFTRKEKAAMPQIVNEVLKRKSTIKEACMKYLLYSSEQLEDAIFLEIKNDI